MQGKAATQTLSIVFPQRLVVMDLVPFAPSKLGRVSNPEAPITQRALARLEPQPELRHLDVCLPAYLALYPEKGTMLRDMPAPYSRTVREPSLLVKAVLHCTASGHRVSSLQWHLLTARSMSWRRIVASDIFA